MLGFAGLDVHKDSVQACLINEQGLTLLQRRFTTSEAGLAALLDVTKDYDCVMEYRSCRQNWLKKLKKNFIIPLKPQSY